MNLRGNLNGISKGLARIGGVPVVQKGMLDFAGVNSFASMGNIQPSDFQKQVQAFRDTVYACVSINMLAVASVPLRVYVKKRSGAKAFRFTKTALVPKKRKDYLFKSGSLANALSGFVDLEELVDHPLAVLLREVNPWHNRMWLIARTVAFMDMTGNAYWWLDKPAENAPPANIWSLRSQFMKIKKDPVRFISGYQFKEGQTEHDYEPTEILHFMIPSLESDYYGMGALMGCIDSYELKQMMTQYEHAMFINGGKVSGFLFRKDGEPIGEDVAKRIQSMWGRKHTGVGNSGKVAMMTGDYEFKEASHSPREMSYRDGKIAMRDDICNSFGVPVSFLSTEHVSNANLQGGRAQHALNAVVPRCTFIQETLNAHLVGMYPADIIVAFDDPVPENTEAMLAERVANMEHGITTRDEERSTMGLEPKGADRLMIPSTLRDIDQEPGEIVEDMVTRVIRKARAELSELPPLKS